MELLDDEPAVRLAFVSDLFGRAVARAVRALPHPSGRIRPHSRRLQDVPEAFPSPLFRAQYRGQYNQRLHAARSSGRPDVVRVCRVFFVLLADPPQPGEERCLHQAVTATLNPRWDLTLSPKLMFESEDDRRVTRQTP